MNNIDILGKFEDSIHAMSPKDEECEHRWVHVGGEYYRCAKCGLEEEA